MATKKHNEATEELKSLKRIEELLTVLVKVNLSEILGNIYKDRKLRILYELTGRLDEKQLSRKTGFSVGKISGIRQKWEQAGLLVKEGVKYRRVL